MMEILGYFLLGSFCGIAAVLCVFFGCIGLYAFLFRFKPDMWPPNMRDVRFCLAAASLWAVVGGYMLLKLAFLFLLLGVAKWAVA